MSDAGGGFGRVGEAPIASEAVRRIDILFEIERTINGKTPEQRLAVRREKSAPIVADLEIWMRQQRTLLSSGHDTAKAINYLLNRWAAFTRLLDDGRVCLSSNAAERALRGVAVGRRNWTFAGSDAGRCRAAAVYTLIETCKMDDVDPKPGSLTCWKSFQITRQQNRRPVAVDSEGGPTVQGRRCCLSAVVNPCAWPGCSPDAYLAPVAQARALVRRLSPPTAVLPAARLCSTPRRCRTIPTMATRSVPVIDATEVLTGCVIERAYVDNGYRGHDAQNPRRVFISGQKRGVFGVHQARV
jgi:hypothetical protein